MVKLVFLLWVKWYLRKDPRAAAVGLCPLLEDVVLAAPAGSSGTPPGREAVFLPFFPLLLVINHSVGIVVFYRFGSVLVYHAEVLDPKSVQTQAAGNVSSRYK